MESDTQICLSCNSEFELGQCWCFDDLGGLFPLHDCEECWPRDRTIYASLHGEHPRVAVAKPEAASYYVYETSTPVPLPDKLMANGKEFVKQWVDGPGPFGEIRQIDVFLVSDERDLLPLCHALQWHLMNARKLLSGKWALVTTELRARKMSRLRRDIEKYLEEEE